MAVRSGYVATQEFGIDPAAATTSVESFVNQCLVQDDLLGLCSAASASAEACCLVTPPGHAILDTGCTSTLVGSENEKRWNEELQRLTGGGLASGGHQKPVLRGSMGRQRPATQ